MDENSNSVASQAFKTLAYKLGCEEEKLRVITTGIKRHYLKRAEIDKKGKRRFIYSPNKELKKLQQGILKYISKKVSLPETFHGYKKKRSNLTNAKCHIGKRVITKLDIKDFFPTVHFQRVSKLFEDVGFNKQEAEILTKLTTADYYLPHGFSTSPILASLMLRNLDRRLRSLFEKIGLHYTYTFFSDDITISGNIDIKKFQNLICKIFRQEGFKINIEKIKYLYYWERQEVTGLVVNDKVNLPKEDRRNIEAIICNCKILGPSTQIDRFWEVYGPPKHGEKTISKFKERILGKLSNLKPVNIKFYNKLLKEYKQINWDKDPQIPHTSN